MDVVRRIRSLLAAGLNTAAPADVTARAKDVVPSAAAR